VATGTLIPVMPALWLVSTDFRWIFLIQIVGGFGWAGFALASGNYLYDTIAPERRARYLALNAVLGAFGVCAGALTGGALAERLPAEFTLGAAAFAWPSALCWLFLLSALARAACMLAFLPRLSEARAVRPLPASGALFRITQYHAQAGLVFGLAVFRRLRRGVHNRA
jgi:MFS family permease